MGSFQAYRGLSCISLGPFSFRLPLFESSDAFVRPSTLRGIPVFGTSGRRKIKVEQIGCCPTAAAASVRDQEKGPFENMRGSKCKRFGLKKNCIAHIAPKSLSYDLISKNSWTTAVRLKCFIQIPMVLPLARNRAKFQQLPGEIWWLHAQPKSRCHMLTHCILPGHKKRLAA